MRACVNVCVCVCDCVGECVCVYAAPKQQGLAFSEMAEAAASTRSINLLGNPKV